MKIVRVKQTCFGCPSQWDAWTEDGTYLYLRYRWGLGTVSVESCKMPGYGMEEYSWFEHGDVLDGIISLEEFCSLAGLELSDQIEYL